MTAPEERCALCPHPADRFQGAPLPPNPPLTMFSCGHAVHTQCMMIHMHFGNHYILNATCFTCNQPLLTPELQIHLRNNRDAAADRVQNEVPRLWENNELFREQVREAAKLERDAAKKRLTVKKQIEILRREWKENTAGYHTILKNLREGYLCRFRDIKGKREAATATGKAQRAKRLIRDTYDLGFYELEALNRVRGAPRFGMFTRRWKWRMNPNYIFRFCL